MKDWKILSIMSARRADQVNRDKMAEDAHKLWEAEKNQRIRASQAHELQHWQTLARNRWKQEQQKVGTFAVLYCAVVTPAKEDMFLSLFMVALCNIYFHALLWSPYVIGRPYIFSSCFFFLLSSFFFFFFSSPNLSGRRLDVYHTLAHGVALVRI